MDLKQRDLGLIGGGIIVSLIAGWWGTTVGLKQAMIYELVTALIILPIVVAMTYFLWKFQDVWGGELGHSFKIMAIGIIMGTTLAVVHAVWHVLGQGTEALPPWGISIDFWIVFFHVGQALFYAITAYGAYRLYEVK